MRRGRFSATTRTTMLRKWGPHHCEALIAVSTVVWSKVTKTCPKSNNSAIHPATRWNFCLFVCCWLFLFVVVFWGVVCLFFVLFCLLVFLVGFCSCLFGISRVYLGDSCPSHLAARGFNNNICKFV